MSIECYEGDCPYHEKEEPFCFLEECQKCPHCGRIGFVSDHHLEKAKIDGSGISVVKCVHCNGTVRVYLRRRVVVTMTCAQPKEEGYVEGTLEVPAKVS